MDTTVDRMTRWGTGPISTADAAAFARHLTIQDADRDGVVRTLADFQPNGMVRGMFFLSLRAALVHAIGERRTRELADAQGLGNRFIPFSLYPHRDFYRFWFAAIPLTHPGRSVAYGIERIAESYFPVFLDSAAGRTMSAFLGSDPMTIVKRISEAYPLSVPHNQHKLVLDGDGLATWTATVEPSPWYEEAFAGIIRGAMEVRSAPMPKIATTDLGRVGAHHRKIAFELDWR